MADFPGVAKKSWSVSIPLGSLRFLLPRRKKSWVLSTLLSAPVAALTKLGHPLPFFSSSSSALLSSSESSLLASSISTSL